METEDGGREAARALKELERKVEALHLDLERKNELLERADMKALLEVERLRFTEQVTDDVWAWAKRRLWVISAIIAVVSIFGGRFIIEATATEKVFEIILGDSSEVVNDIKDLKAEAEAALVTLSNEREAFDAKVDEAEARMTEVESRLADAVSSTEIARALRDEFVPDMRRRLEDKDDFDEDIANWVFWTKIEVANERAKLLAQLREDNPELTWPTAVRTLGELSELRDRKVIVYVTRRPHQTYPERLKLADDTRDRFIRYGYFAETYVAGPRDSRDENGVDHTVRGDLSAVAAEIGASDALVDQKCRSLCILTDLRNDDIDMDEIRREILRGEFGARTVPEARAEFTMVDGIATVRDYAKAFPATQIVEDSNAIVVVLGSVD